MNWKQDPCDYSWFATDALGYFYRVTKVMPLDGSWHFACAWTEVGGLRQSAILDGDLESAKARMDNIASLDEEPANSVDEERVSQLEGV